MQKLYCYVDESGQDTLAQPGKKLAIFVVGVVVLDVKQRQLEAACIQYEKKSGKGIAPWHKAKYAFRLDFIRMVIADKRFIGVLRSQVFQQPAKLFFDTYTLQGIANAIGAEFKDMQCVKEIYVDGLTRSKQSEYAVELRRLEVKRASFHRATDHSSPLLRLADALAGLVREAEEDKNSEVAHLLKQGKTLGAIIDCG